MCDGAKRSRLTQVKSRESRSRSRESPLPKHHHRRSPAAAAAVGVVEGFDEIEGGQKLSDVLALHADAAAVDEAHLPESSGARFGEVVAGHIADFVRAKGVEVERVGDRELDGVGFGDVVIGHAGDSKSLAAEPAGPGRAGVLARRWNRGRY